MAQPDTIVRILDTAEQLFAERGFAETSLRTITSRAGVNLAAVNYHFGSKKALIQAVFERFLTPFCAALDAALDRRLAGEASGAIPLDELFALIATTTTALHARNPPRSVVFMRLIGLAYNESQGHLRRYLGAQYGRTFGRLERLLAAAMPDLPREELFWRTHFALGSVLFTLSGLAPLSAIAAAEFGGGPPDFSAVAARLQTFVASGIRQGGAA
ncbi:MAG: TetR/AcrR family transcriptional regulator [Pseudomonadota bacterium]